MYLNSSHLLSLEFSIPSRYKHDTYKENTHPYVHYSFLATRVHSNKVQWYHCTKPRCNSYIARLIGFDSWWGRMGGGVANVITLLLIKAQCYRYIKTNVLPFGGILGSAVTTLTRTLRQLTVTKQGGSRCNRLCLTRNDIQ